MIALPQVVGAAACKSATKSKAFPGAYSRKCIARKDNPVVKATSGPPDVITASASSTSTSGSSAGVTLLAPPPLQVAPEPAAAPAPAQAVTSPPTFGPFLTALFDALQG